MKCCMLFGALAVFVYRIHTVQVINIGYTSRLSARTLGAN